MQADPIPIQEILDNPGLFFENLRANKRHHTKLRVLNYIIYYCNKYKDVYISQRKIADLLGKSANWISHLIQELEAWGLIATQYRVFRTKRYKLSSFFYQPHITWRLSSIFTSLSKIWNYMVKNLSVVSSINDICNYYLKQIESLSTTQDSETLNPKSSENSQKEKVLHSSDNSRAHLYSVYFQHMLAKELALNAYLIR